MPPDSPSFEHLLPLMAAGIIPLLIIVSTCFAKTAIVLHVLKNAFGSNGIPPITVITGLTLVISIFIMAPVFEDMAHIAHHRSQTDTTPVDVPWTHWISVATDTGAPLVSFMKTNTPQKELRFYHNLKKPTDSDPDTTPQDAYSIPVILMAFASAELKEALILGALLFLPFALIDLLTASTLTAVGIGSVSVVAISLPLKLILFVSTDGFGLLIKTLSMSYTT